MRDCVVLARATPEGLSRRTQAPSSVEIDSGQLVRSGDLIVGDRDGLTVIPAGEIDAVIAAAEERERKEQKMRERIESGEMTVDILDLRPTLQRLGMG